MFDFVIPPEIIPIIFSGLIVFPIAWYFVNKREAKVTV
jgi:hypothetical protein